jgi:HAE1 family hydrophobic/amphiphilic exporter-1
MERTTIVANELHDIARSIPEIDNVLQVVGQNMMAGSGSAYAQIILEFKHWSERKGISNKDIIAKFMQKSSHIRDATIIPFSLPTITGFGLTGGFSFQLQDKGGHTTDEFYKVAQDFLSALNKRPEIQYATTSFNPNCPQYLMEVNVPKIKEAGLTVDNIMHSMQGYFGGVYAANFNQFGKQYRIMIQAEPEYRANIEALNKVYVRNSTNEMAPITEFITLSRVYGPESISRFNLFTSIPIQGSPGMGYSSGQALAAIGEVASQTLHSGYGYELSGISREEEKSGGQSGYVFLLSLLFVYFLLSALYESYLLPFAVILSLPVGLTGTFVFARIFGIDNNIYTQISLIMLIGLLAKNAILIVQFALARRLKGMSIVQAAVEAAKVRLRPILMTSFAFIFGVFPLMIATGAGANGNRSIGTSAVGGMLFGTLFGIFVIPILYILFQTLQEKVSRKKYVEEEPIS